MTKTEVLKILSGRFADPKDKKYWEDVLKEIERKERTAKENEKYYRKMSKYDRGYGGGYSPK